MNACKRNVGLNDNEYLPG